MSLIPDPSSLTICWRKTCTTAFLLRVQVVSLGVQFCLVRAVLQFCVPIASKKLREHYVNFH